MSERTVSIYGKDGCPYTGAACADFGSRGYLVRYFNVQKDGERLREMLVHSDGKRKVPTIVEDGRVTIGFGGA